jgi:hypothetical protein
LKQATRIAGQDNSGLTKDKVLQAFEMLVDSL